MLHKVVKTIDFCYGHRLLDYEGKCRHLHGHNGLLEVEIESESLDHRGMVMDFSDLRGVVKDWVDRNLDHKMLLHKDDPVASILSEMGEPFYPMEDNPTAENILKHIYRQIRKEGLMVSEMRLWETPSSYASYREESQWNE